MQYDVLIIKCKEAQQELLIAVLSNFGAESFWQEEEQLTVSFTENVTISKAEIQEIAETIAHLDTAIAFEWQVVEKENWNQQWEDSFSPLVIADQIYVHAGFHPKRADLPLQIEVTPKMSFGTGHHGTTAGMMEMMLTLDWQDKTVLDMGTGTGILAILAKKLGASKTLAIDNDEWAVENSIENVRTNGFDDIQVELGTDVPSEWPEFDMVLSNITLNCNLDNFNLYKRVCKKGGYLLLSGFYAEDASKLETVYQAEFEIVNLFENNRWGVLICKKK